MGIVGLARLKVKADLAARGVWPTEMSILGQYRISRFFIYPILFKKPLRLKANIG
jgi:hypothetical protein